MNNNQLHTNALRKWWYFPFLIYVVPNVLMALFVIVFKLLLVDEIPVALTASSFVIILIAVLIISVFFYIKLLSQYYNKKALKYEDSTSSKYLPVIIFALQILDLVTLLLFDYGRVGGAATSGNLLVRFVSYLPTDTLFLLYYGHNRKKGIPYLNLAIYLLINILKGWTGIWVVLFLVEIYFQLNKVSFGRIIKKSAIIIVAILALYPTINKYKYLIRGGEYYEPHTLLQSFGELAIRLQHTTNVILIAQETNTLKAGLSTGEIYPYYLDNRIGSYLVGANSVSIQKYLSVNYLIDKDQLSPGTTADDLGWFVHVGIVGWFFVLSPLGSIFYVLFITLIIIIPFFLNHYFLKSAGLIPVIQTLTFLYAFHGWFTVHIAFISGIILYIITNNFFKLLKKLKMPDQDIPLPQATS